MAVSRDRANRHTRLIYIPLNALRGIGRARPGEVIHLKNVNEEPIDCAVRDAQEMSDPRNGNAVGDAIFDAQAKDSGENAFDANLT